MTKLEQKLIELGYDGMFVGNDNNIYYKKQTKRIVLNSKCEKIVTSYLRLPSLEIDSQKQIKNIQQAFNQLQNDLKELKEYE
jgi:TfoX/Sxy family transcriptional regulator of competence genes